MQRSMAGSAFLILIAMVLAACGGSSAASPTANGDGSAAPGTSTAVQTPAATTAPDGSSAIAPTEPGTGNGPATDTCGLVTVAEMEALFGFTGVTQELIQGPPDTCDYQRDGAPFVAAVLVTEQADLTFSIWSADEGVQTFSGIGEAAIYAPSNELFIVKKNGAVYSFGVLDVELLEDRIEWMKKIATIAAGRM